MRLVAVLVGLWLAIAGARRAAACGSWAMTDVEKSRDIGYLINSVSIHSGERRVGAIYLDTEAKDGLRSVRERKVIFDVKGDKLRKLGKVIGTIDRTADTVTIKGVTYAIALTDYHEEHEGMPAWKLEVRRGDKVIVTAEHASSLCAGMGRGLTQDESKEEVRRRVIFYLAWRATGA
jgi:hypothetical protein